MTTSRRNDTRRLGRASALTLAALVSLGGCSGDGADSAGQPTVQAHRVRALATEAEAGLTFEQLVLAARQIIQFATSDTSEPLDTRGIVLPTSETTEPLPVN